ncbi:hypothetical protein BU14_0300s0007 [Porphyra umbilicalis]|uniref:Uncharacterized protein n=1 Tax=Porphyra umbilicalis TaxID=2786 RepID=A0A1X6P0C1_PORUM|nr:hypothetical protein BU14_0300s0007 [Porphyra umbilicalis]|eukprot:OSX74210.1 hypothetical protein BU14_0300s0007 [Porphyra umbilicalis]
MQTLAAHVGIVSGRHLAALAGDEYPPSMRAVLFAAAQASILAFDVAEVVGTAVALRMLTGLPLVGGMVVSAVDTVAILYLQRYGLRAVEWVMEGLLALILVCVIGDAAAAGPDWAAAAWGAVVPSLPAADGVVGGVGGVGDSAFLAVSLLGAVVMPHNAFLHSGLVLDHREEVLDDVAAEILAAESGVEGNGGNGVDTVSLASLGEEGDTRGGAFGGDYVPIPDAPPPPPPPARHTPTCDLATSTRHRRTAAARAAAVPAACALATLENGLALTGSLVANAAVLSVAASQFYPHRALPAFSNVGLADAAALLSSLLPRAPRTAAAAWGVALLASGHCATVTGTMASAYVCEGFLPGLAARAGAGGTAGGGPADGQGRGGGAAAAAAGAGPSTAFWGGVNLATRAAAIVPAVAVAVAGGERGADALIVGSQVVVSFALPFAIVPLLRIAADVLPAGGGEGGGGCGGGSGGWLRVGWATAAVAVAGNVWLVVDGLRELHGGGGGGGRGGGGGGRRHRAGAGGRARRRRARRVRGARRTLGRPPDERRAAAGRARAGGGGEAKECLADAPASYYGTEAVV